MLPLNTYFENIKPIILTELELACVSIQLAVAWFTDDDLFGKLLDKCKIGVKVEIILNDDEINNSSGLDLLEIIKAGGNISFANSELMHHKFCVIDSNVIISGSYNWTRKANSNVENITVLRSKEIAKE